MSEFVREKIGTILAIMGLGLFFASMGIVFVPILASLFVVLLMLDGGIDVSRPRSGSRRRSARTF